MAHSHGDGSFTVDALARCGKGVVFEPGSLVFHPENVELGDNVYVGHYAILKGYYKGRMVIGSGSWIGQGAFLHSAGGLVVGESVGIGPGVQILTSKHTLPERPDVPILHGELAFAPVELGDGCDIGAGAVVLPGVRVGMGAQVGAGAVVSRDVPALSIVAGVPAREIGRRSGSVNQNDS